MKAHVALLLFKGNGYLRSNEVSVKTKLELKDTMGSYTVLGRKNQLYIIDLESIQWLEFLDDKFVILINRGGKDEVCLLVSKNKFPEIKTNLLAKVFSLM